jgi:hypothetical protein
VCLPAVSRLAHLSRHRDVVTSLALSLGDDTFRLRPRGYDVRAYRRHRRALAHVLERTSVKLAVHEQREVDLTGQ